MSDSLNNRDRNFDGDKEFDMNIRENGSGVQGGDNDSRNLADSNVSSSFRNDRAKDQVSGGTLDSQESQVVQGVSGSQNVQGEQSIRGVQDAHGMRGSQGVDGSQVVQGEQSIRGVQDVHGMRGVQGVNGSQVVQGEQSARDVQAANGGQGQGNVPSRAYGGVNPQAGAGRSGIAAGGSGIPTYRYSDMDKPPFPQDGRGGKRKKEKRGIGAAALAVTCALSILLSAAAGFGGAVLYFELMGDSHVSDSDIGSSGGGGAVPVIFKNAEVSGEEVSGGSALEKVSALVSDTVVEITTEYITTGSFQYITAGAGSGVIFSQDGYIITNNHVVENSDNGNAADTIKVRLSDGTEYTAELIGRDSDMDIAVLKIDASELRCAVFGDSSALAVGQTVLAVGNPLGTLGGTKTSGIISALDREITVEGTVMNLMQFDAAINPGNSGGGLFNMKGELIGVVNAKSSGSGIEGLGFAIPANDALHVIEEIIKFGYVTGKPFIGVSLYECSDAYSAYRYFGSRSAGIYVTDLEEGYNEDQLKFGDRVTAVNGSEVSSVSDIEKILKDSSVGDKLTFSVYRESKLTDVEIEVFEYVPDKDSK